MLLFKPPFCKYLLFADAKANCLKAKLQLFTSAIA